MHTCTSDINLFIFVTFRDNFESLVPNEVTFKFRLPSAWTLCSVMNRGMLSSFSSTLMGATKMRPVVAPMRAHL